MLLHTAFGLDLTDWGAIVAVVSAIVGCVYWIGTRIDKVATRLKDFNHFIAEVSELGEKVKNLTEKWDIHVTEHVAESNRITQMRSTIETRLTELREIVDSILLREKK